MLIDGEKLAERNNVKLRYESRETLLAHVTRYVCYDYKNRWQIGTSEKGAETRRCESKTI